MDRSRVSDIKRRIGFLLGLIGPHLEEDERWRKGGWLHVSDNTNRVVLHERIGEVDETLKDAKYKRLSLEEWERLRRYGERRTSWETRDPELDKYGGAISTQDGWTFSFSGLPEIWDQALMLAAVSAFEPTLEAEMERIAAPGVIELVQLMRGLL